MNIKELKIAISELPDEMDVLTFDKEGEYSNSDAAVVEVKEWKYGERETIYYDFPDRSKKDQVLVNALLIS